MSAETLYNNKQNNLNMNYKKLVKDLDLVAFPITLKFDDNGNKIKNSARLPKDWDKIKTCQNINDCESFAIKTGEDFKITLFDFDIKNNGKEDIDVEKELKEKLNLDYFEDGFNKKRNILVQTSSGGFHIITAYDERFETATNYKGIKGLDIKNKGGIIFAGKNYEIYDDYLNDFKGLGLINKDFAKKLLDYQNPKKIKPEKNLTVRKKNIRNDISEMTEMNFENVDKIKELIDILDEEYSDNRSTWINVGLFLKDKIEDEDEAYEIWDKFSRKSNKYNARKNIKDWDNFKPETYTGDKIGFGTIVNYAKDSDIDAYNVWNKKWNKISDIKEFDFKDEYFYDDFVNGLIENNKVWNDLKEIEKYINQNINRVMFCVRSQGKRNQYFGRLDRSKGIIPLELSDDLVMYKNGKKIEKKKLCNLIENNFYNSIKKYNYMDFIPYSECIPVKEEDLNKKNFNLYQGFKATLLSEDDVDVEKAKVWIDLIKTILANNDEAISLYILSWFHHIFTNPNEKTKVNLVFRSKNQQVGKGFILNNFIGKYIFGELYHQETGLGFLTERFNSSQQCKLFCVGEELSTVNDSYNSTFDILKQRTTDDYLMVEPKFGKRYPVRHRTNYVFNTNHNFPIKTELGNMRISVHECNESLSGNFEFFENFKSKYMNQDYANHVYSYIYRLKNPVEIRNIPKTELGQSIKLNSQHSAIKFLNDVRHIELTKEHNINDTPYITEIKNKMNDKNEIKAHDLFTCYNIWCNSSNEKCTSETRFGTMIKSHIEWERKSSGMIYFLDKIDLKQLD